MKIKIPLLILFLAYLVPAQGTIRGRVLSSLTGRPVPRAMIEVSGGDVMQETDSAGTFRIDSLISGSYDLVVRHVEYLPAMIHNVILLDGGTEEREIELFPQALDLAAKRVTARPVQKIYDMPNSTRVLDAEEIRRTPGALMDVQRVVQKFPGIQSRGDNVNEVIARGGFPGENLFILDNIEIPNPNYFGNQGTGGGVISVVNPLLVKKLTFNSGSPPARYGGKASSVLDIHLRDGNDKFIFGGMDLGFAGAGILADGPLWQGATFLSSFRKSYLDVVAEFEPSTAIPRFWGGQAKVTQKIGSGKAYANGLVGKSSIRIENAEESFGTEGDVIEAGGEIYATGATVERYVGNDWEFSATVSGTGNIIRREQYFKGADTVLSERKTQEYENTVKAEANHFAANKSKWTLGGEFKLLEFRDDNRGMPDTLRAYASPSDTLGSPFMDASGREVEKWIAPSSSIDTRKYALYASVNFALMPRLFLALGARGEGFEYSEDWFVMPRASLSWAMTDELELTSALGLQTQAQNFPDYSARPENRDLRSKRAGVVSVEMDWFVKELSTSIGLNLYVKGYENLVMDSVFAGEDPFQFQGSPARLDDGTALSRGAELFVERKLARNWFFSVAYAYSLSETRFEAINGNEPFPSDFDYTHLANFTGGAVYDLLPLPWYNDMKRKTWFKSLCWLIPLGDRMEASARVRYATGRPRTPMVYDESFRRWRFATESMNAVRFPDYQSLDIRLERRIGYGWLRMMFYFDFQNVLGRDNVFAYVYNDKTGKRVTVNQLPFFPMGGFIIGF